MSDNINEPLNEVDEELAAEIKRWRSSGRWMIIGLVIAVVGFFLMMIADEYLDEMYFKIFAFLMAGGVMSFISNLWYRITHSNPN